MEKSGVTGEVVLVLGPGLGSAYFASGDGESWQVLQQKWCLGRRIQSGECKNSLGHGGKGTESPLA